MSNGTVRNALAEMQIKGKAVTSEVEVLKSYDKKAPAKIALKNVTKANRSK